MTFGTGIPLRQHSPSLRSNKERAVRIVDAAERNSVIEGLPRFGKQRRAQMIRKLTKAS
ncbi:MAG: hypothetical protein V1926_01855 [Candidatus Peregrinibacteria bacterium]